MLDDLSREDAAQRIRFDVIIEYRSPVSERVKLLSVSPENAGARTLNDNFRKLNAFLFGDQDYAAIATK